MDKYYKVVVQLFETGGWWLKRDVESRVFYIDLSPQSSSDTKQK